jgi:hypothetical protein
VDFARASIVMRWHRSNRRRWQRVLTDRVHKMVRAVADLEKPLICADDELLDAAFELATRIAARSPIAVSMIKPAVYQSQAIDCTPAWT